MSRLRLGYALIITEQFDIRVPHDEMPFLAISKDGKWYREISQTDLLECHKIRDIHYCPQEGSTFKDTGGSCLMSLWKGLQLNNDTLLNTCQARLKPPSASIDQVAENLYMVEATHRFDLTVHCGPHHQDNEVSSHTGAILVQLAPGCVGQTFFLSLIHI